jgi:Zn-dependent protease/CBS domain-containing protein
VSAEKEVAENLRGSIKLFSIAGIPVDINASWLIAVAIITWSLSTTAYPSFFRLWSEPQYWLAGIVTTLLLFTSVLAHELGHSLVALSQGLRVRGITLLLFGGVSRIQGEASRPRNEFLIAFAGPVVSLVIGLALLGWWFKFHPVHEIQVTPLHGVIFFTGWMNILVAGFNLLPGYPMDGGRVLRSAVWGFTGDTKRASRVAYAVGRVVFFLLIGWGAWRILSGDVFGGVWVALIGWFLMSSARAEARREAAKERSQQDASSPVEQDHLSFPVELASSSMPSMVEADLTVTQAMTGMASMDPASSIPVSHNGELSGFIVRQDLGDVPFAQRSSVVVGELVNSGSLRVISSDAPVREALGEMDKHRVSQLVVMDDDYVIGIVTRQGIVQALLEFQPVSEHSDSTDDETSL